MILKPGICVINGGTRARVREGGGTIRLGVGVEGTADRCHVAPYALGCDWRKNNLGFSHPAAPLLSIVTESTESPVDSWDALCR